MPDYHKFSQQPRRLTGYDYRSEGLYFVTICTKDRQCCFGQVVNDAMELSAMGMIAHDYWLDIPLHALHVRLGTFVVMPNHIYGILDITGVVLPRNASLPNPDNLPGQPASPVPGNEHMANLSPKADSLSRIIGSYKAACTQMIRSVCTDPFGWQPRFHDRIIRNQRELENIERYIMNNLIHWTSNDFHHPM